jgi:bifunctional DNase/RNase
MSSEEAIEMFVGGLVLDPNTQAPVVILKDEEGKLSLPIWIGVPEATGIASAVKQLNLARPLTHDLMSEVLSEIGVTVQRILISDIKESTYIAELVCSLGDRTFIFDCRPSDALNIAIRCSAPIFVAQSVLSKANIVAEGDEEGGGEAEAEGAKVDFQSIDKDKWNTILDELDPDDFKYRM